MKIYIETLPAARRELAKTYDLYKKLEISSDTAKTRVTILRAIMESVWKYEIEIRLEELEAKINGGVN